MNTTAATIIHTACSGCAVEVVLHLNGGTATAVSPSNGKRGALHVAASRVVVDLDSVDDDLACWGCPVCGYADSFDRTGE